MDIDDQKRRFLHKKHNESILKVENLDDPYDLYQDAGNFSQLYDGPEIREDGVRWNSWKQEGEGHEGFRDRMEQNDYSKVVMTGSNRFRMGKDP